MITSQVVKGSMEGILFLYAATDVNNFTNLSSSNELHVKATGNPDTNVHTPWLVHECARKFPKEYMRQLVEVRTFHLKYFLYNTKRLPFILERLPTLHRNFPSYATVTVAA